MMYLRFAAYAAMSFAFKVFVYLTAPWWAAWAALGNLDKLPTPYDLISTHDDNIYGSKTTGDPKPKSVSRRFARALWWLYRNPGYTFDAEVLGFAVSDLVSAKEVKPGRWRFVTKDGRKWFYYGSNALGKIDLGWGQKAKAGFYKINITFNPFKKD